MSNEDRGQQTPLITQAELARILTGFFDEDGLYSLSFDLGIDYENLRQGNKEVKARSLITQLQQQKRIPELVERIRQLRPHFQLNVQRLAHELIEPGDPKLKELDSLIYQFQNYYGKLLEWKELHNHLDELLNIYEQYATNVERFARNGIPIAQEDMDSLERSWRPINRRVSVFIIWASDIQHIDQPFEILETGDKRGAKWAVELSELHDAVEESVRRYPDSLLGQRDTSNRWLRIIRPLIDNDSHTLLWRQYWQSLRENTREFDNTIRRHLYLADKELRKSASDLHDLSKGALWS